MNLSELNDLADRYIERIAQGESQLLEELHAACLPRFLYFRKRYGFSVISVEEVTEDLAYEAINLTFIRYKEGDRPFSFYLINAFRDLCRKRKREMDRERLSGIAGECGCTIPVGVGQYTRPVPPHVQAERNEFNEELDRILANHPSLSKRLVLEKKRGSTYRELAELNYVSLKECRRVHEHDMYHIKKDISDGHRG